MNNSSFLSVIGFILALALFVGCESPRLQQPAAAPPRGRSAITSAQQPPTPNEIIGAGAAKPLVPAGGDGWHSLFGGSSLNGWRVTDFGVVGRVEIKQGLMVFRAGGPFTGVNYTNPIPKLNYEITLEAMRVAGEDFFCGLTFPAGDSFASLIVGGWGGTVVGISSIDGADASQNETSQNMTFETGRWYRIRLRVSEPKIEAWMDGKKIINAVTAGHKLSLRFGEIERSKPFGLASWLTTAAFRDIEIRNVEGPADPSN